MSLNNKKGRMLEIFYRLLRGERISVKDIAGDYGVSSKSISRDIAEIKAFLSEARDLVGNAELKYSQSSKHHYLEFDDFLLNKELLAVIKMMIGARGFSKEELTGIIDKMKKFTTHHDREVMDSLVAKELYHYNEVKNDCDSVVDVIWKLTKSIDEQREISVSYYKMSRELVERRIKLIAILFSDYYFYLVAYRSDIDDWKPLFYRVDRVVGIVEHRSFFDLPRDHNFNEGEMRNKIQFMFPGEYRTIKFSYSGQSVQAILDRIPTAKILEEKEGKYIIEAEIFGVGINMFLLSQGSRVQALAPQDFVEEMKSEVEKMCLLYK